jgi:cytochrome c oxidase assembly factor CtaG
MTTTATPPSTGATAPSRAPRWGPLAVALAALAVIATGVAMVTAGGAYEPATPGLPDPGPIVGWGLPISRVLTDLAAALTAAWLIGAAFLDPAGKAGVVSPLGRADLWRTVLAAAGWAVLALTQMLFTVANVLGVPLTEALRPDILSTYAMEIPTSRALAVTALFAAVVAVAAVFMSSTAGAAVLLVITIAGASLPTLAGHGSGLGDHALALSAGVTHIAAALVWLGGLILLAVHGLRRSTGFSDAASLQRAASRFGMAALIAVILLAVSGIANSYTRLDTIDQLLTSDYGRTILGKVILLAALVGIAAIVRRRLIPQLDSARRVRTLLRILTLEISLIVVAFGLGVALALSDYPRIESLLPTFGETLLGYPYPPPPTATNVIFGFLLEPVFLLGGIVLAAMYVMGVLRLRARGDRWPIGRTISWLAGIGVMIWTTNAGIALYSQVSVGLHMVQHMTMAMVAPMLMVLGGPFTLALRALRPSPGPQRGPREWIVWGLHSPAAKVVTNPLFVFVIFSLSMFVLYFTPTMAWLMGSHIGHVFMQFHFIGSGYLFAWIIMGVDPVPNPLPYWAKFALVLITLGVHGFFSVIVMMGSEPLAQDWYGIVRPDWVTDPLNDTILGGQVAWGISEIPMLFMVIMVTLQWMRSDEREARRKDRQAARDGDAELDAYNAYLERLNRG